MDEPTAHPTVEGIRAAAKAIDPVFATTPQFVSTPLSDVLRAETVVKVETLNPLRSFKGRGTGWLFARLGTPDVPVVTASAGNFGQGVAYNGTRAGWQVTVFAAESANPMKVDAMRRLGAEVRLTGHDLDAAKDAARAFADERGLRFIEDGAVPAIAEGAGTIGLELTEGVPDLDAVVLPVGNGALITGVGTWLRHASPNTRVIGVCAESAPAMLQSWRERRPIATDSAETIADGIAVRVPIPVAVAAMEHTVDDMIAASEDQILQAMRLALQHVGVLLEPAGAAAIAGCLARPDLVEGRRVAVVLCGANVTEEQYRRWFQ
jgi:threonine dehydratase